jgi:hypothetical protein
MQTSFAMQLHRFYQPFDLNQYNQRAPSEAFNLLKINFSRVQHLSKINTPKVK